MRIFRRHVMMVVGTVAVLLGGAAAVAVARTSSRGPSRLSERQILRIATAAARGAGDGTPTLIQHSEGTRARANLITCGCGVPGDEASYLIAERGHFTAYGASPPPGAPLPTGSVLTLVVNASTGEVTDWGVSNRYPRLAALGPVKTDLRVAPSGVGSVRLEVSPQVAHPGGWVKLVIVNGTPRLIVWGGCYAWQRWVRDKWQGGLGTCLAFVPFGPHSRATKVVHLADHLLPGRYRINFVYQDSPATGRQPEQVAYADLTVVSQVAPRATGTGVLTGAIRFVGGPSTVKPRSPSAGEVIVASLTARRVVARELVRAGHDFRFRLRPGGYELQAFAHSDCPAVEAIVYTGRTTRVDVDFGCSIP